MKYNIARPYFYQEDIEGILKEFRYILEGNGLFTKGPNVKKFEKLFAQNIGAKYAVAVNSCTSALEMAIKSIKLNSTSEVIVPVQTFIATGSCIVTNNALPVFCEVDENHQIDFNDLKKKITPRTKAVIIVHFGGFIHPEIFEIKKYLELRNIYLIEDVAHAQGAKLNGVFAGNIGDIGCFSFYSTKIMTTAGEGGMITTNNKKTANYCSSVSAIGINKSSSVEEYTEIGGNRRMNEIQAITGIYQLKRLEKFISHRNHIANIYRQELDNLFNKNIISFQATHKNSVNAYWRFIVNLKNSSISREVLKVKLNNKGINIDWPYQPLMHLQPVFLKMFNFSEEDFIQSLRITSSHFCLPIHMGISKSDAKYIASEVKKILL